MSQMSFLSQILESRSRMSNPVDRHVGARIRSRREALRMPAQSLALAVGVSPAELAACEDGSEHVTARVLYEVCRTLRTTPADIFEGMDLPRGLAIERGWD